MNKKQLKKRIKELEFENEMLRAMRPYPVYYQVYSGGTSHVTIAEDNTDWYTPLVEEFKKLDVSYCCG